jgi:hypothetical protein
MLSRCANPQCFARFLQLGTGRLFLIEAESSAEAKDPNRPRSFDSPAKLRHVERYWLCDECAKVWTLVQNDQKGISLLPLRRAVESGMDIAPGTQTA